MFFSLSVKKDINILDVVDAKLSKTPLNSFFFFYK